MTVKLDQDRAYIDWKTWDLSQFANYTGADAAYFAAELAASGLSSIRAKHVLEVGFGSGTFAGWARDHAADYLGTEINLDLLHAAARCGFAVVSADQLGKTELRQDSFDLIVAFDVFEHMEYEELVELLRTIHGKMRSGGIVVARVPSGDSPFARAIQNGDMTHKIRLGSSALPYLASRAGFQLTAVREPVLPLWGGGAKTFIRRASVQAVRKIAFPIIANCFMGGGHVVLTPNMVFVLSKP